MVYLSWANFKTFVDTQGLTITAIPQGSDYYLTVTDGTLSCETVVVNGTANYTTFVNSYLAGSNQGYKRTRTDLRLSQYDGRVAKKGYASAVTTSTTLYTVTSGKVLYITTMGISATNTHTTVTGNFNISDDDVAILLPYVVAVNSNQTPASITAHATFPEPVPVTTNVRLKIVAGTITASAWFIGYEE